MTLRTDLTDDTTAASVHAAQHNEANAAVVALQGDTSVQSVVAGTNITVNSTDPHNPVVSATGGAPDSYALLTLAAAVPDMTNPNNTTLTWTASVVGSDIELLVDTQTIQFLTAGRYSWYMEIAAHLPAGVGNVGLSVVNLMANPIMDPINDSFDQTFDSSAGQFDGVIPWTFPEVTFAAGDQLKWKTAGSRASGGTLALHTSTFLIIRRAA